MGKEDFLEKHKSQRAFVAKRILESQVEMEFDALLFNVLLYRFPALLFWVMTLFDFVCE